MFGKRLVALRKQKKISQYDLAAQLDLSRGQLSNYELGTREPDFETLRKITKYFDVTADYLLGFSDTQEITSIDNISSAKFTKLPVLGSIRAGIPILAAENIEGHLDVPDYIKADYVLIVKDDSMIGAGILCGDYALCSEAELANSGQIVVALNDLATGLSEATFKYYFDNGQESLLRPANPNYPEISMNEGYRIAGVMVALFRGDVLKHHLYENYLAVSDVEEWAEIIALASQTGLMVHQVKEILIGQIEIAKRLKGI